MRTWICERGVAAGAPEAAYKLLATFLHFEIPFGAMDLGKMGF